MRFLCRLYTKVWKWARVIEWILHASYPTVSELGWHVLLLFLRVFFNELWRGGRGTQKPVIHYHFTHTPLLPNKQKFAKDLQVGSTRNPLNLKKFAPCHFHRLYRCWTVVWTMGVMVKLWTHQLCLLTNFLLDQVQVCTIVVCCETMVHNMLWLLSFLFWGDGSVLHTWQKPLN